MKKTFVILVLLLFFAGCRTVQAPETPCRKWGLPDWEKAELKDDPVWDSIREKDIDTSHPLALIELVNIALSNNPDTRAAWENARAAQAVEGQAESEWFPDIDVSGTVTREKTHYSQKLGNIDDLKYGPGLKFTYLLLDFGGRRAKVEEAAQMLMAANFQFNRSIQDLLLSVEKAYYGLYSTWSGLEAADANLKDAEKAYEAARQKCEVGLGSELDVLQEKSNYDNALYAAEEAEEGFKTAKADLAQVLGLPADIEFEIAPPADEIPRDISSDDVGALIEDALKQRPDISALRSSVKAKEAAVKSANSDLLPTLNAGGSGDKNWYEYYHAQDKRGDSYGYNGYLSVNWDIFDGFYNLNRKREAEAKRDAEVQKLIKAELQASADVWTSYYAFKASVKKLTFSEAFLENAQASYDLAFEGYNTGLKSVLDLLKAQSDLSSARSKLIQSKKDLFYALADLAYATGELYVKEIDITKDIDTENINIHIGPDKNFGLRDRED